MKHSSRRFIVFTTLVGVLTLTSALLLALSPAPLTPDISNTLFAIDSPESMEAVFQTHAPIAKDRWKFIYIHHSDTLSVETVPRPGSETLVVPIQNSS